MRCTFQEAAKRAALVLGKRRRKATVYNEEKLARGTALSPQATKGRADSDNDTDFQPVAEDASNGSDDDEEEGNEDLEPEVCRQTPKP